MVMKPNAKNNAEPETSPAARADVVICGIATREITTPFGTLILAASARGIAGVGDPNEIAEDFLKRIEPRIVGGTVRRESNRADSLAAKKLLHRASVELEASLNGKSVVLKTPLDLGPSTFRVRIWEALRKVPFGSRITYAALAAAAGHPGSVRAAARANRSAIAPVFIPTHRAVNAAGEIMAPQSDPWTPIRVHLYKQERLRIGDAKRISGVSDSVKNRRITK
ncbi:MAG: methylated-DNA--[protein]-cysteine S-methyltransferase [Planctomycetes bacterium]|nr:methylated-DNA--[protein]-cysteine S-methyltransferase [Planctomycetota bacterium]